MTAAQVTQPDTLTAILQSLAAGQRASEERQMQMQAQLALQQETQQGILEGIRQ